MAEGYSLGCGDHVPLSGLRNAPECPTRFPSHNRLSLALYLIGVNINCCRVVANNLTLSPLTLPVRVPALQVGLVDQRFPPSITRNWRRLLRTKPATRG